MYSGAGCNCKFHINATVSADLFTFLVNAEVAVYVGGGFSPLLRVSLPVGVTNADYPFTLPNTHGVPTLIRIEPATTIRQQGSSFGINRSAAIVGSVSNV